MNPFSIAIFLQRSISTYLLKDSIFPKRPILWKVFSHIKLPLGAFLLPRNSGYSGWDVNGEHHLPVACVAAGPRVGLDHWRRFRVSATQASIRAFQWKIPGNKWNYFRFLRWKRSDGDECFIYECSQRFTSFMLFTAISCDAILNYDERREWTLLLQKTPSSIKIFHGIIFQTKGTQVVAKSDVNHFFWVSNLKLILSALESFRFFR